MKISIKRQPRLSKINKGQTFVRNFFRDKKIPSISMESICPSVG